LLQQRWRRAGPTVELKPSHGMQGSRPGLRQHPGRFVFRLPPGTAAFPSNTRAQRRTGEPMTPTRTFTVTTPMPRPRNPLVVPSRRRSAGAHASARKAGGGAARTAGRQRAAFARWHELDRWQDTP
jgi:hypothetical protein